MSFHRSFLLLPVWVVIMTGPGGADTPPPAIVSSIESSALKDFDRQPAPVRALIEHALELTTKTLGYKPGGDEVSDGGMDCSGAVYATLRASGVTDVPRSSLAQYEWVWKKNLFRAVNGRSFESIEFSALAPGDLLFWTGTWSPAEKRDPPVSHVMIYLGQLKSDGRRVMFGSSDGRPFNGRRHSGVSVFDFKLPAADSAARFIGYAPVPGLTTAPTGSRKGI